MSRTMMFTKLDFITVKPYLTLRNIIIFVVVAFTTALISGRSSTLAMSILMMYAAIFVSYPFVVGEQSGTDILFATLSIKRNTVVLGRYLFAFTMQLATGAFAYVSTFVVSAFLRQGFDYANNFFVLAEMFFFFTLLQFIQIPVFFKFGYTKAKLFIYLPFVIIPVGVALLSTVLKDVVTQEQIERVLASLSANPAAFALGAAALWLLLFCVSYRISLGIYNRKDF